MKRRLWGNFVWACLLLLAGLFAGCSGGSSSDSSDTAAASPSTLSGAVADGYLVGATVFADCNGNRQLDSTEVSTQTVEGGAYTLSGVGLDQCPVVAIVDEYVVDEDTGTTVGKKYVLSAPAGRPGFISPITTIIHELAEQMTGTEPQVAIASAEETVRGRLSIPTGTSLFDNYLAAQDDLDQARVHQIAQLVASSFAVVQAGLDARLQDTEDGLGLTETDLLALTDVIVTRVVQAILDSLPEVIANTFVPPVFSAGDLTTLVASGDSDGDGILNGAETDSDNDGHIDSADAFPYDSNEWLDSDGDRVGDNRDAFPSDPAASVDTDGDGKPDFIKSGFTTILVVDDDDDNDGLLDTDELTRKSNPLSNDTDKDKVLDAVDNCIIRYNPLQADLDQDGIGDLCDADLDGDGFDAGVDNCPMLANADQLDSDLDGLGNVCDGDDDGDGILDTADNCPLSANPAQQDLDLDGKGDSCDDDIDGDTVLNGSDNCTYVPNPLQENTSGGAYGDACNEDDDSDGVVDTADNCPIVDNADQLNTDGDLTGDACDDDDDNDGLSDVEEGLLGTSPVLADTDGDGVADNVDLFPLDLANWADADSDQVGDNTDNCWSVANTNQADNDKDGVGDACDPDDDNDGVSDALDVFPFDQAESLDTDGDGIGNNADTDDDGDSVLDVDDAFPLDASESVDTDGDGIGNNADTDDDGDSVADTADAFPLDASESVDTDGDGIGNNADTDDDGDSVLDVDDAFPLDASESVDTDGDGIGNNADTDDDGDSVLDVDDVFPLNSAESVDTDSDGIGNNADTDDDGDGVLDGDDAFPLDPSESVDTDGDGIGNNADTDDDGDSVLDTADAFPLDASESVDTDGDGIGNNADTDDDGDSVLDVDDAFPLDASESVDTDGDGIGNNADSDDDGDSVLDTADAFPLDKNESVDTDGDGIGNNADTDDDNDSVLDAADAFPLDKNESVDTDSDGIGNNADTDDDGDTVLDSSDNCPLVANPDQADLDGNGVGDACQSDVDHDGVPDDVDNCIDTANASQANNDLDLYGDACDPDDDNDGLTDAQEGIIGSNPFVADSDGDGVNDSADAFPTDAAASIDTDGDGAPDKWNDGKSAADSTTGLILDDFPSDATEQDSAARPDFEAGMAALKTFQTDELNADALLAATSFAAAKSAVDDSDDNSTVADSARFLYALTRVAKVAFDTQSDGNPSDLSSFSDFLDRLNVPADYADRSTYNTIALPETCVQAEDDMGHPMYEMDGVTPIMDCELNPLPANAPTSGEALGFIESTLGGDQGALADAISALDLIAASYQDVWVEAGQLVEAGTEIDYSDVLFIRGLAQGLRAQINILQAYNLNVDVDAMYAAASAAEAEVDSCRADCESDFGFDTPAYWDCEDGCWELEYNPVSLLAGNPDLLKVQAASKLAAAKGQIVAGLNDIKSAVIAVQAEEDGQDNDFVAFYGCWWDGYLMQEVCSSPTEMEEDITQVLTDINKALTVANATNAVTIVTDDMGTAGTADDKTLSVNPAAFFGGLVDFRALLPVDENGDFTMFPDTTLGGVLPVDGNGVDPLELNTDLDEDGVADLLQDDYSQFSEALLANRAISADGRDSNDNFAFAVALAPTHTFELTRWDGNGDAVTETGTWAVTNGELILTSDGIKPSVYTPMTMTMDWGDFGEGWLDVEYTWSAPNAMSGRGWMFQQNDI